MDGACMTTKGELPPPTGKGPTRECVVIPHNGSVPHALFYDLTHDNETYLHKRSAEDALSTGALMTFSYSAIGSVKGFDDLYPKLLDLVSEKRKYEITQLGERSGIAKAKRLLNALHTEMALEGYVEGHVHQENDVGVCFLPGCFNVLIVPPVYRAPPRATPDAKGICSCRAHGVPQGLQGSRIQ